MQGCVLIRRALRAMPPYLWLWRGFGFVTHSNKLMLMSVVNVKT